MNHDRHVCGFFPPCPSLCWVLWRSSQSLTSSVGQLIPQRRRGRARIQSRLVWLLSSMPRKKVEVHVEYVMCRQLLCLSTLVFSNCGCTSLEPEADALVSQMPYKGLFSWKWGVPTESGDPTGEFCGVAVLFWFLLALSEYLWLLGLENACLRLGLSVLSFIFIMP